MRLKTIIQLERMKRFDTAKQFARAAGVDWLRYKRFEAGFKYYHLKADELARLADVLKIPVETFATEKGAPIFGDWWAE